MKKEVIVIIPKELSGENNFLNINGCPLAQVMSKMFPEFDISVGGDCLDILNPKTKEKWRYRIIEDPNYINNLPFFCFDGSTTDLNIKLVLSE
jgi:hypothetical protein